MTASKTSQSPLESSGNSRLLTLVERANEFVAQLQAISEKQGEAIHSGEVEAIAKCVSDREPIVRSLVEVGEEIDVILKSEDAESQKLALKHIRSIEVEMKKLRDQDALDQEAMRSLQESIAGRLQSTGNNQSALRAYSTRSQQNQPTFQDREV